MAPMDIVHLDVHPVDILFSLASGDTARIRLIGAQDHATRRFFAYPVYLGPGRGVRQGEVVEMFIEMTQDPYWGLPKN